MIRLRRRFPFLAEERFYSAADVTWFGLDGAQPDWNSPARTLGCHLHPEGYQDELCLLFNAEPQTAVFSLPPPLRGAAGWRWECATAGEPSKIQSVVTDSWRLTSRSLLLLSACRTD
jgi:glycogen operon protein